MARALFERVRQLNLPTDDFAIFGSGPLVVRHIIPSSTDLDILCRGEAWETVCQRGTREYLPDYAVTVVALCNGAITFGRDWGIGKFDINELIDTAEIIDSLPFVRLKHVVEYKRIRSSAKDLLHLEALRVSGQVHI